MSKKENGRPRIAVNRKGKYPYIIEERGPLFLIKQNENTVVIPAKDLKWIIETFTAILEHEEHKRTTSQQRQRKLYEPQSARQQRDKKQRCGEIY
jgi:hypothetical protein